MKLSHTEALVVNQDIDECNNEVVEIVHQFQQGLISVSELVHWCDGKGLDVMSASYTEVVLTVEIENALGSTMVYYKFK